MPFSESRVSYGNFEKCRTDRHYCGYSVKHTVLDNSYSGGDTLGWVVERSLAWFSRNRRLSKDYERLSDTEEAFLYASSVRLMLKRLDRLRT